MRDALTALLGAGDGAWAAAMRTAVLLGEKTAERAELFAGLRAERLGRTARDSVRRALVEALLHGSRADLVATWTKRCSGFAPDPRSTWRRRLRPWRLAASELRW